MLTLREGDRISNYLLEERVGAGSFGEVWRARHHVFGDIVAIKIPTDTEYVRNLQREGVAVHGLKHPNIVRAIDMDPYGDPPYLIMEYVEGPSLRAAIDTYKREFPIDAAVEIMRGVLQALAAAHAAGLVHRDVKPANLLLNHPLEQLPSITERAVRVTDFGLGRIGGLTTQSIMQSGSLKTEDGRSIAGTLAYMSPEQKDGRELDACSDLYACGIVLFEILTGERPQGSDLPSALRPDVPRFLDEVFQRAYTRRERRYGSAEEMLAALLLTAKTPTETSAVSSPRWAAPSGGLRCPDCDGTVHRDDQFCIRCGRQLVASVPRCPNHECQAFVHPTDRYCIFCGTSLQVLTE
jgi:serine/threonine-protein kinase